MSDPAEIVDSSMLGGLQPIRLPRARHERAQRPWWEASRLCAIRHFIEPGAVVYDIGAEQGDFTALYAMWGARVVAVEPNPKAWPAIRLCCEANGVGPMACFDGFAAAESNTGWLGVDEGEGVWPASSTESYDPATGFLTIAEYPDVPRLTVDHLSGMVGEPGIITIDVEGAEGEVLRGASYVLAKDRPYVFVSLHPDEWLATYGDTQAGITALMMDAGYEWVPVATDPHERHDLWVPAEKMWPR